MDYSKWKKILIILMIINLLWIFYNRVFASTDLTISSPENYTFSLADKFNDYTYRYLLYNPDFTYDNNSAMSFYFVAAKSVIYFTQETRSFLGQSVLVTVINTQDSNSYYLYSQNMLKSETFLNNITLFNSNVNNSARTYNSGQGAIQFDDYGVTDNTQLLNKVVPLYTSSNIYFDNGSLAVPDTSYRKPTFDNSDSEIQSLDFDNLFVKPQDYGTEEKLYLKILEVTSVVTDPQDVSQNIYYYNDLTFALDSKSKYLKQFFDTELYYYSIPYSALKLKKDKSYYFLLTSTGEQINQTQGEIVENDTIFDTILVDTQNLITTQDEILNSIINNNPSQNTDDNINNNLPRPGYDNQDNNINIPGMNVDIPNDLTADGFNTIFNTIYNALYAATQPSPR